jgi:hypothetical protein
MASVLDVVMELPQVSNIPASTPASVEAPRTKAKVSKKFDEAGMTQTIFEAGPSIPAEARPSEITPLTLEKEGASEKSKSPAPGAPVEGVEFIVQHASRKRLSEEQIVKTQHYVKDLKYPRGSLIYGGDDEDDFLYCLADNKEINVCREMVDNIGYPKLELGLSVMSKDQLADNLAYNSLKVCIFWSTVP